MRVGLLALTACGRIGFGPLEDGGPGAGGGDGAAGDGIALGDGSRPDIMFTTNVAFVTTNTVVPGNLGGLVGADATCQAQADASGLPGTYIAWLSTSTTNAIDRLSGSRGWVRPDGLPLVDQPNDIVTSGLITPLSLQADGSDQVFASLDVITGTDDAGLAASTTCTDWTMATATGGSGGRLDATDQVFTASTDASTACDVPTRIYCFGVGLTTPPAFPTVQGRRAFLSNVATLGGGLASLDSQCQATADAAALGGTFQAFIATSTVAAGSRFDPAGLPFVRLDGVPLAPTAADLLTTGFRVPLNVTAGGTVNTISFATWFGATAPNVTDGLSCTDWTSTAASMYGYAGLSRRASGNGLAYVQVRCGANARLYCLEP